MPEPQPAAAPPAHAPWRPWPRRLGWRLLWGFGLVLALMFATAWLARQQLQAMARVSEQVSTEDLPRLLRIQLLALHSESTSTGLLQLMNLPRAERVPVYTLVDERNRQMQGVIESLSMAQPTPEQARLLDELVAARQVYQGAYIEMAEHIEAGENPAAQQAFSQRVQPALVAMQTASSGLLQAERERVSATLADSQRRFQQAEWTTGGLFAAALALALALAWLTTRSVVRPIQSLQAGARRIAQGDYQQTVPTTHTEEMDQLVGALNQAATAVGQREADIQRLATTDALTGLPNRLAVLRWGVAELGAAGGVFAVLDIARLRGVNETLGFDAGDRVIVQAAARVQALLRPGERLACLSGGRFGVWLAQADGARVDALLEGLDDLAAQPMPCGEHSVDVPLVAGLVRCQACQERVYPMAQLLRDAEIAQLSAKRRAQPWAWYEAAQEAARLEQLGLLGDLRSAAREHQLQMWLQPKVAAPDGHLIGAEALVRWRHPQRGLVPPGDFLPFAERTGAITTVTRWMLEQALQTLTRWHTDGHALKLSVNVSTRDLQDAGFLPALRAALAHHPTAPERLVLEVTESGLMEDPEGAVATLHTIRALGVGLSIDDFGTGYSSLAYLQTLPVHELKIDRAFVDRLDQRPANRLLVGAMVAMGHGLGLSVTAEGVETPAEIAALQALGVDTLQGYVHGKPMPLAEFEQWRDAHRAE